MPRTTEEEKQFGDFDIFDDPERHYSTFNFKYSNLAFERLTKLTEFNTLLYKDLIMDKIKECIVKKKENFVRVHRPIKLADIKRLQLSNRKKEQKLAKYVQSFDDDELWPL